MEDNINTEWLDATESEVMNDVNVDESTFDTFNITASMSDYSDDSGDEDSGNDWWDWGDDDSGGYYDENGNPISEDEWNETYGDDVLDELDPNFGAPVVEGEVDAAVAAQGASAAAGAATQKAEDARQKAEDARQSFGVAVSKAQDAMKAADQAYQKATQLIDEVKKAEEIEQLLGKPSNQLTDEELSKIDAWIASHGVTSKDPVGKIDEAQNKINEINKDAQKALDEYTKAVDAQKAAAGELNDARAAYDKSVIDAKESADKAEKATLDYQEKTSLANALAQEAKDNWVASKAEEQAQIQGQTVQQTTTEQSSTAQPSQTGIANDQYTNQIVSNLAKGGYTVTDKELSAIRAMDKDLKNLMLSFSNKGDFKTAANLMNASRSAQEGNVLAAIGYGLKGGLGTVTSVMVHLFGGVPALVVSAAKAFINNLKDPNRFPINVSDEERDFVDAMAEDEDVVAELQSLSELDSTVDQKKMYDFMKNTGATNISEYNAGLQEDVNKVVSDASKKIIKCSPYVLSAVSKWKK